MANTTAAASASASNAAAIDYALVERSIGFHGIPMQKVWEGEHGDQDLARAAIAPDFGVYQVRQKRFVFTDRVKRHRLHQFIAHKADVLFARQPAAGGANAKVAATGIVDEELRSVVPPYNYYFTETHDASAQLRHIYTLLNIGDVVYAQITNRTGPGVFANVLCTHPPNFHYLGDLKAQAFLSNTELVPAIDRRGATRAYIVGDYVLCEILEIAPDAERMVIGMRGLHRNGGVDGPSSALGLICLDQFPAVYKELTSAANVRRTYMERLDESAAFKNPHIVNDLARQIGLDLDERYTNVSSLRHCYPADQYSGELRQQQANKWAFRSVADGIEHFKEGRHTEAFQCLNKALSIDPRNVEGLVARGALYANSGSFKKAVDDFETALKLNAGHANARKYMGETLVALGRSYEEVNNIEEAKNSYQACLNIIPAHEEARNSLEFLWSKAVIEKNAYEAEKLTLPALNLKISDQNRDASHKKQSNKKSKKSKKSKSRSKRDSSSSSSSTSDSTESSTDSSSDSTSSTDSDSYSKSKKKHRSRSRQKHASLSPFSKRIATMANESNATASRSTASLLNAGPQSSVFAAQNPLDDYELKVRKFLELTRDEDDYEQKVRQFLDEANRYRNERKASAAVLERENKASSKKKEKHKKRKSHRASKKKRSKDKRSKSSRRDKRNESASKHHAAADHDNMDLREAIQIIKNLPDMDISKKLFEFEKTIIATPQIEEKKEQTTKWKMQFAKEKTAGGPSTVKLQPKQNAFNVDDDSDDDAAVVNPVALAKAVAVPSTSTANPNTIIQPVIQTAAIITPRPPPKPVVLDKFGSFKLAEAPDHNGTAAAFSTAASSSTSGILASTQRHNSRSRSRSSSRGERRRHSSSRQRDSSSLVRRSGGRRRRSASRSRSRSANSRSSPVSRRSRRRLDDRERSRRRSSGAAGRGGAGHDDKSSRSSSRSRSYSRSRSRSVERRGHAGGNGDRRQQGYEGHQQRGAGGGNGTYYRPLCKYFNNFRGGGGGGNNNPNMMNYNNNHGNNRGGAMGGFHNNRFGNSQSYANSNFYQNRGGGHLQNNRFNYPNNNHNFRNYNPNYNNNPNNNNRGRWMNRGQGGNFRWNNNNGGNNGGSRYNRQDSSSSSDERDKEAADSGERQRRTEAPDARKDRRRRDRSQSSRNDDDDEEEEEEGRASTTDSSRRSVESKRAAASAKTQANASGEKK